MKSFLLSTLLSFFVTVAVVESFTANTTPTSVSVARSRSRSFALASSATDEASKEAPATTKLLKRDRYIASNRFSVRAGKEAKFEKRWANRKSRLAELDGFRYFHLMRRVTLDDDKEGVKYDGGDDKESSQGNYVSLTVWEDKNNFNAWRKGDAFREAHGGTSVGAFMKTMVSSLLVLRGAPKPAFYDGLLVQSEAPEFMPETVDGWRNVEFPEDGGALPVECFVACNQFYVPSSNAASFEQRWKNRESQLNFCEGFVSFFMQRRDAKTKTHGSVEMDESTEPTYVSCTIWKDRASFEKWRFGNNFSKVHGGSKQGGEPKGAAAAKDGKESAPDKKPAPKGPPQWSRPPKPIFYEGTLVLSTKDGA